MSKFIKLAKQDKRVKALHKALNKGAYHIDIAGVENEIDSLHINRLVRSLKTQELLVSFQKKFLDAALQNQAYRSRLVEIKVKCFRVSAKLEEHIEVVKSYLSIKYPNSLRAYKTIGERKAVIESVLEEPTAFLKRLELKDKELEVMIKDLDQTGFTLKHIIDAMQYNKDNTQRF